MSGPQFSHLQTYSRKPNPGGQSVAQILGEAARDPDFSKHIDKPAVPDLIYGMSLAALSKAHDDMCNGASVFVQLKNGKTATRAVRKDRHTLCTFVASYPVPRHKIEEDKTGQEKALFEEWKKLNIEYLRRKYGYQLATVIEHKDEAFGHIHAFILPTNHDDIDARSLNPAFEVKRRVMAEVQFAQEQSHKAAGTTPKQPDKEKKERGEAWDALVAGNRAYKTAARAMADEYYAEVGAPAGLTREGPKRRRLSRGEWLRETTDARASSRLALEAQKNKAQEEAREEAQMIIDEAGFIANQIVSSVKMKQKSAEILVEKAKAEITTLQNFNKLVWAKVREWFGQDKHDALGKAVVAAWAVSPDNPDRVVDLPKPSSSSSYSP